VGIGLIEVKRARKIFEGRADHLTSVFAEEGLRYYKDQPRPFHHLAARFAAKEACFKILGTGLTGEMEWRDVEVVRTLSGESSLRLQGATAQVAREQGVVGHALSLSHSGRYAIAVVLLNLRGPTVCPNPGESVCALWVPPKVAVKAFLQG
jgi:holo-[acyl-carrier protein] synthase